MWRSTPYKKDDRYELYFMCDGLRSEISREQRRVVCGGAGSQPGFDHEDPAARRKRGWSLPAKASIRGGSDQTGRRFEASATDFQNGGLERILTLADADTELLERSPARRSPAGKVKA